MQPGTHPRHRQSVTIAADGSVYAPLPGPISADLGGQLHLATFVNPAGLEPKGQNLFTETAASGTPNTAAPGSNGLGTLSQGYVETSNVNVVEELVAMIQTQRAYEINPRRSRPDQMLRVWASCEARDPSDAIHRTHRPSSCWRCRL